MNQPKAAKLKDFPEWMQEKIAKAIFKKSKTEILKWRITGIMLITTTAISAATKLNICLALSLCLTIWWISLAGYVGRLTELTRPKTIREEMQEIINNPEYKVQGRWNR